MKPNNIILLSAGNFIFKVLIWLPVGLLSPGAAASVVPLHPSPKNAAATSYTSVYTNASLVPEWATSGSQGYNFFLKNKRKSGLLTIAP
jgi:hypothetical protein